MGGHTLIRKKALLLFIVIMLAGASCAQYRHGHRSRSDFPILSIGPEIGIIPYLAFLRPQDMKFYLGYSLGGSINFRPVKPLSLSTGFSYNRIIKTSQFYRTPIQLDFVIKDDFAIRVGVVLYFDANQDEINFREPLIGGVLGFGMGNAGIYIKYIPTRILFRDSERTIFLFGCGMTYSLHLVLI